MRIISGRWRGRRLTAPDTDRTRPLLDRVRVSLFDRLGAMLAEPGTLPPLNVLDLFAGSGGIGLEALSRGAAHCCFIENAPLALRALRANIVHLDCGAQCLVLPSDALRAGVPVPWPPGYSLAFVDPPYRLVTDRRTSAAVPALIARLAAGPALLPDALILFRCEREVDLDLSACKPAKLMDVQTFGRMAIWWLRATPSRADSAETGPGNHAQNDAV